MRGSQVLCRVEFPCALPLILSGVRNASLQVIATATVAAEIGLGGLGRYIIDGIAQQCTSPRPRRGRCWSRRLAIIIDLFWALVARLASRADCLAVSARRRGPLRPWSRRTTVTLLRGGPAAASAT